MRALIRALSTRFFSRSHHIRLQVLSDLHLEVGQQYISFTFPVTAPYLLLAGDVGRLIDYEQYFAFLETLVARYKKVLLVLGNHEFYGLDYESGLDLAQRLAAEPSLRDGVILLHEARWDDPDSSLTVVGCTLWSNIPKDRHGIAEAKINDFKRINGWTVHKHNQVHADQVAWLRHQLGEIAAHENDPNKRQLVVATHHAPCLEGTSHPSHANKPWVSAFATDLMTSGGWDGVKAWVFGHTHYSTDVKLQNGIRLVANQRGYVLPNSATDGGGDKRTGKGSHGFDASMTITLNQWIPRVGQRTRDRKQGLNDGRKRQRHSKE